MAEAVFLTLKHVPVTAVAVKPDIVGSDVKVKISTYNLFCSKDHQSYDGYTVNTILHRTNTSLEVFCIERILQYFFGNHFVHRFDVERKYENRFQRPNKIKN